jgi:hypothetical protein
MEIIYKIVFPITAFGGFVTALTCYIKYKKILLQDNEKDKIIERQMTDQEKILQMVNEISSSVLATFDRLSLGFNNELKEIKLSLQKHQLQMETMKEDITILKNQMLKRNNNY